MNIPSAFPQIIYGKLVGNNDSEYQIIAWNNQHTSAPNLPPYRFWGQSSPDVNNIRTVGLVWDKNQPILIQATTPINPKTNQFFRFTDSKRSFTQYRYVFLTSEFLTHIEGRIYQLLEWLYSQTIELYPQVNQNLDNLEITLSSETNNDSEIVESFLNNSNSNHSLIFTTQNYLLSKKRVLLTSDKLSFKPNDFLATLLLLFPIAIRCKVSIAIGIIDEKYCEWADLIIKLNQSNGGWFNQNRVSDNVVWLNQFLNKKQEDLSFNSNYVNCLQSITQNTNHLSELLTQLNQMNSEKIILVQPIHPQAIIPLIKLLPNEQQKDYLERYVSNLNPAQLRETIPLLKENQQGLLYIAQELIKHDQQEYATQFIEVWGLITQPEAILPFINPLSHFTVALLKQGLLNYHFDRLTEGLTNLCCQVARIISPDEAWSFACELEQYFINYPQRYIKLLDAPFSQPFQVNSELFQNPDYLHKIIALIPQLPEGEQDSYWKKYLGNLNERQWEDIIDSIQSETGINCAWNYLCNLRLQNESKYASLAVKLWSKMTAIQQINILDNQLNQHLPLAEKLINCNLHIQPQTEEITAKLRLLCQNVIEYKARADVSQGWSLAVKLEKDTIFKSVQDKFDLFDSTFVADFRETDFYQVFGLKVVNFLPYLDANKVISSKFSRQLKKKNLQAANLLYSLFTNKNQDLSEVPQFTILMRMNVKQQDNFYYDLLNNCQLNYVYAKNVLISLLKLNEQQKIEFIFTSYVKTCSYLTKDKPELKDIINQFNQGDINWQIWYRLGNLLWDNPQSALLFLDRLLGRHKFKIEILKCWLSFISDNKITIPKFSQTSHTWQCLQENEFYQLLNTTPESAIILTRCLRDSQRLNWIKEDLLHCLGEIWIKQKSIDEDLKFLITIPNVVKNFTVDEHLKLMEIKFRLVAISHPNNRNLPWTKQNISNTRSNSPHKNELHSAPQQSNITTSKQYKSEGFDLLKNPLNQPTLSNEDKINLTRLAKKIVQNYENIFPQQLQIILSDCQSWGLSESQIKEIIKIAKSPTYTISLLFPYLISSNFNPTEDIQLLEQFLQLEPKDKQETEDYKKLIKDLLIQDIKSNSDFEYIELLRSKVPESFLEKALDEVVKSLILTEYLLNLRDLCIKLKSYSDIHTRLAKMIVKNLDNVL
ncbi:hypothetical protein [Okeania sp. SIO2B3]|uniref:hypothetical protein n=1 Tax=Okeania sp. SIO2B3 TaxID=2607784 RepID=UPI0013C16B5B|nr:hypothetical protein [Okeania sp. SIO2B3]NET45436.1 hypothetical protein [Okeania sp. SIO2B3]